jgi:hypothetical protein
VKEQIFEVGHHAKVKAKLIELLTSEVVEVIAMTHEASFVASTNINDEGGLACYICFLVCVETKC